MLKSSRINRLAALVGTTLMVSGLAVVIGQSPALALDCRSSENNNVNPPYATGYCTGSGTSKYYRVVADCEENSGRTYISYGGYTWGGSSSRAYCATNGIVRDSWMSIAT